jgi:pimeloyl-ACP methyl ester carboxylesterase
MSIEECTLNQNFACLIKPRYMTSMRKAVNMIRTRTGLIEVFLGVLLVSLGLLSCVRCPEAKYGNLKEKVLPPETKNNGVDLKGWTYERIVSPKSGETHYYYQLQATDSDQDSAKPTFVFIHGLLFDGKNFLDLKPLAEHFNLIAYDLPNQSSFYKGNTDDFPALLSDFFESIKLNEIYLGGVSLGGQIAMIYTAKPRPVTVKGLLLMATDLPKDEKSLRKSRRLARNTARITGREEEKTLCVVTKLTDRKKKEAGGKLEALNALVLRRVEFYNQVLDTSINMSDLVPLKSIKVKTLIIHGDQDSVVAIDDARALVDSIPDAELVTIEGGEHAIAYSHAKEIVQLVEKRFVSATAPEAE